MSILTILEFPDKRLRTVASEVEQVDAGIKKLVDDMIETMYSAKGVGLAATQVNVHKRVIVMDVSENKDNPICLINPQISRATASKNPKKAACRCRVFSKSQPCRAY